MSKETRVSKTKERSLAYHLHIYIFYFPHESVLTFVVQYTSKKSSIDHDALGFLY